MENCLRNEMVCQNSESGVVGRLRTNIRSENQTHFKAKTAMSPSYFQITAQKMFDREKCRMSFFGVFFSC